MYLPAHFGSKDEELLLELVRRHDFVQLCVVDDGGDLEIAHVPVHVAVDDGELVLRAHVARANPLWKLADGARTFTAVFAGPHAYVSPRWYVAPHEQVPTWNYAVVHAVGPARAVEDRAWLRKLLVDLSATHEPADGWTVEQLQPEKLERLLGGIVGVELRAPALTGKLKLSQNRAPEDQDGVLANLPDPELVALMRRVLRGA